MGDNWDDDDWETAADTFVYGEDKFAGEDAQPAASYSAAPAPQTKKTPTESKYAAKDREFAAKAGLSLENMTPEEQKAALEAAEVAAAQELFGDSKDGKAAIEAMEPKSNADFEELAKLIAEHYVTKHAGAKQYKYFVKQLAKAIVVPLEKDEMKDVETAVAGVRTERVKADLAAAKAARTGSKKFLKMERDDISAGMDNMNFKGLGDADDDVDFM